jgi:ankyrin repeat protein
MKSKEDLYNILINDNLDLFINFIEGEDINRISDLNPLLMSLSNNSLKIIDFLLNLGADQDITFINSLEGYASSPCIFYEISRSKSDFDNGFGEYPSKEILDLFNKYGLKVERTNIENYGLPNINLLKTLIRGNVNNNLINIDGETPLDFAIKLNNIPAVLYLLDTGFKISKAFFINKKERFFNYLKNIKIEDCIDTSKPKILHKEIIRINKNVMSGKKTYPIGFLDYMLKEVENINEKNEDGNTPLDFAMQIGNTEAVKFLREHGGKTSKELEDERNS